MLAGAGATVVGAVRDVAKARAALAGTERGARRARARLTRQRAPLRALVRRELPQAERAGEQRGRHGVSARAARRTDSSASSARTTSVTSCSRASWCRSSSPARRRASSRVSSRGHLLAGPSFDDPNYERAPYNAWEAYGRSKSSNVLLAVELDRRLRARGVRANAIHPGGIMTELGRHLTPEMIADDARALQRARVRCPFKEVPARRGDAGLGGGLAGARRRGRRVSRGRVARVTRARGPEDSPASPARHGSRRRAPALGRCRRSSSASVRVLSPARASASRKPSTW